MFDPSLTFIPSRGQIMEQKQNLRIDQKFQENLDKLKFPLMNINQLADVKIERKDKIERTEQDEKDYLNNLK